MPSSPTSHDNQKCLDIAGWPLGDKSACGWEPLLREALQGQGCGFCVHCPVLGSWFRAVRIGGAPCIFVEGRDEQSWPTPQLYYVKRGMEISRNAFKFCVLGTSKVSVTSIILSAMLECNSVPLLPSTPPPKKSPGGSGIGPSANNQNADLSKSPNSRPPSHMLSALPPTSDIP